MIDLCKSTNITKHDRLIKQKRINSGKLKVNNIELVNFTERLENSCITFEDCTINGIEHKGEIKIQNGKLISGHEYNDVQLVSEPKFIFEDINIDILILLKESYNNTMDLIKRIYDILESL